MIHANVQLSALDLEVLRRALVAWREGLVQPEVDIYPPETGEAIQVMVDYTFTLSERLSEASDMLRRRAEDERKAAIDGSPF